MKKQIAKSAKLEPEKLVLICATFTVFILAMVFVGVYLSTDVYGNNAYFDKYNKVINNELARIISNQKKMDDKINDISENGGYTFEKPCILTNPYKISPLSALVIFDTTDEKEVKVAVNGREVTTMVQTKKHLIPIYGLFANAKNTVTLTMDGKTKTFDINTEPYNNDLNDYDLSQNIDDYNTIFVIGELYKNLNLRGFDYNNNLMFYLDLKNVNGITFQKDHFYIAYNSENSNGNELVDIKIEMDYLGRIYSIDTNTNTLSKFANLSVDDEHVYIMEKHNIYNEITDNFKTAELIDNSSVSRANPVESSKISKELKEAKLYPNKYLMAANGSYLTFDFPNVKGNATLLLVNKSDSFVYHYPINNIHMLKIRDIKKAALYLYVDGKYYNLLTTYEN